MTTAARDQAATTAEIEALHREGYFVREGFFSPSELYEVEQAADRAIDFYNQRSRGGDMYSSVSHKDGIQFVNEFQDESGNKDALRRFAMQPKIVEFARAIAGPRTAHHCYQVVYKFPQFHHPFPWHQDHIHTPTDRYFYNMWIALNDMNVENGCLRVLPGIGLDKVFDYHDTPSGRACWPMDHSNQGIPLEMKRGSVFVITSKTLHSSGGNYTNGMRKALLVVFVSSEATVYGQPVRCLRYQMT